MYREFTCEEKFSPRGLVIINWNTVLVGRTNNSLVHRGFYSFPSSIFYTNTERSGGIPNMLIADKQELDDNDWSGDFLPCGNLFIGFVLGHTNGKSGPLHGVASPSSLIGMNSEKYVIVQAFARPVWYSLFAILVLIAFLLHVVLRREEAVVHAGSEAPPWETSEVLLVTIGAICQQGSHRHPDTAAARTIFTCLFSLSVIMYTAYSAAFVALLSPPIHHNHHAKFMDSLDDIRFQVRKLSIEHLASVILKSNVVLCTIKHLPHNLEHNCTLLFHNESGEEVVEALRQETISENPEVFEDNQLNFAKNGQTGIISLTMGDAYPAFLLLISGTIAAVLLLIIEIMRHQQNLDNKFKVRGFKGLRKLGKCYSRTAFSYK